MTDGVLERAAVVSPRGPELDAPAVLRIVSFFDRVIAQSASLDELARSIAVLTGRCAGLGRAAGGALHGFDGDGEPVGVDPAAATRRDVCTDGTDVTQVWIETQGAGPLDDFLVDRFVLAVQLVSERIERGGLAPQPVPVLVEVLIDGASPPMARTRACRRLGYQPADPVRVAVLESPGGATAELDRLARTIQKAGCGVPRIALLGDQAVLVLRGAVEPELLELRTSGRMGVGPVRTALGAAESYRGALDALRFTHGPGAPGTAHFDRLGSIVTLVAVADARSVPPGDRTALDELSRTQTGLSAILTAEVLMRAGSQRHAATQLNLHHSSVVHRVAHVEAALGYSLADHGNWFRAQLAIHLWRLEWTWPDPTAR